MKTPITAIFFAFLLSASPALVQAETASDRVQSAATVLQEIMSAPDKGIPEEVVGSAKCIAVVPSLLKGGFIVGAAHGRGMASCRTESGWSAPAPFSVSGGSFGFQIGVQGVDLVMMVMNDRGMQALLSSQFKLGADASAAAGPVGRHAEGSTDWKLRAEVLTYSRARGVFAGVTLNGAVIHQDDDATRQLYGRMISFRTLLTGAIPTTEGGEPFVSAVRKAAGNQTSASGTAPKASVPVNPPPVSAAPVPTAAPTPAAAPTDQAVPSATPPPPATSGPGPGE